MPDIAAIDKRYVWHPFTQMQDWAKDDNIVIESGRGVYLRDAEGREYIDGVASLWCNVHGHQRKEIGDAIRAQLDRVAHSTLLGLASPPSALVAERLVELAPEGLTRVFYSDSGATAVEVAIKMAFQYWAQRENSRPGKTKFISLHEAYHGDTLGAVSAGGMELFHECFRPLLFETYSAPSPYQRPPDGVSREQHCRNCVAELERIMEEHADDIAGMLIEPMVQGAAGIWVSPPGYLKNVRELCDRYDILMIADEVAVGFGRTGKMFACEHEAVTPDLMCLGKGLTGGYLPVAATITTENVYEAFLGEYRDLKTFFHGHTFTGNALGCAAALANLEIFEKDNVLEMIQPRIRQLHHRFEDDFEPLEHVGDARHCGLMAGVEIVQQREPWTPYEFGAQMGYKVCRAASRHGILVRPLGNVIVIMPPLCISEEELDRLLDGIRESIITVTER